MALYSSIEGLGEITERLRHQAAAEVERWCAPLAKAAPASPKPHEKMKM